MDAYFRNPISEYYLRYLLSKMVAVIDAQTSAIDCLSFNEWRFGILSYVYAESGRGCWGSGLDGALLFVKFTTFVTSPCRPAIQRSFPGINTVSLGYFDRSG